MFQQKIARILAKQLSLGESEILPLLERPPAELGDFAFPCFSLAKKLKKMPTLIAEEIAEQCRDELFSRVEAKGPYVNFFLTQQAWLQTLNTPLTRELEKETVLLEFPSPNTNKPLHLGHVRNMILGSTMAEILTASGKKAVKVNLNNDRGVHICKSMIAYKLFFEGKEPDKKTDHFVGDCYVRFAQEAEKDPSLNDKAQEMLRKWEQGDGEILALWKKMNNWAYRGWKKTFEEFGITFDKEYYESDIYSEGKKIILDNKELFTEEEGAVVAELDEYKLPKKVLLRSDGTAIYMTQDIALTIQKQKDFSPDKQVWIVGNEQELHFRQLFAILDILGHKAEYHHLSYGMIELPSGKMKSREGTVVDADDLLDKMKELSFEQIKERHPEWSEEQLERTSHELALAAIKFFIIKYEPAKNFVFNPESSLSFEGDTGPYLQYTHARICSILRQSDEEGNIDVLGDEETAVCKALDVLRESFVQSTELKPHLLAQQLLVLARSVNSYYHATPVLKAEKDIRSARLSFLREVKEHIATTLSLLGITALEEM